MKKITLLSLVIAAVVFVSCGHSADRLQKKPDHLIPKDTMVVMIAEQLIYEATLDFVKQEIEREDTTLCQQVNTLVEGEVITLDSLKMGSMHVLSKLSGNYYGPWLNKRGYTSEQYEESLIYYFNTSQSTQDIMNEVKDYITRKYGGTIPPPNLNPEMPHTPL